MEEYDMCEYLARSVAMETRPYTMAASLVTGTNQTFTSSFSNSNNVTMTTLGGSATLSSFTSGPDDFVRTAGNLEELKYYLYGYVNPLLCGFGLLGNLLNIIVLTRRRMQAAMDSSMERTARYNLIALALSDMLYCAVTFPRAFLATQIVHQSHEIPQLYLRAYGSALQSIFMYTSTWLTVILAVGRYAAICRPIETRYLSDIKVTIAGIFSAFFLCAVFRLPMFWTFRILRYDCSNILPPTVNNADRIFYYLDTGHFIASKKLNTIFTYSWFACGYLVPVAILFYCNAHLVHALRASQRVRAMYRVSPKAPVTFSWRVTATLIAIVCMFIAFVSPSEIVRFYYYAIGRESVERFNMALVVTNVLLTGNFGCNFILYCAVNAHFRNTWCHCLKCASALQQQRGGSSKGQGRCKRRYTFTRSTAGSYCRRSGVGMALLVHGADTVAGAAYTAGELGSGTHSPACGGGGGAGYVASVDSRSGNGSGGDVINEMADMCQVTYFELASRHNTAGGFR